MKILLTRTAENNKRTGERISKLGHEVISIPLGNVKALDATVLPTTNNYIITSSAAFECMPKDINLKAHVYCVGKRTAQAALDFGLEHVKIVADNAADLAEQIRTKFGEEPTHFAYLAAKHHSFDFFTAFENTKITIETYTLYEIERLKPSKETFLSQMELARNGVQFHYSALSARYFFDLVREFGASELSITMDSIAISDYTSHAVDISLVKSARNAKMADEASMLKQLELLIERDQLT